MVDARAIVFEYLYEGNLSAEEIKITAVAVHNVNGFDRYTSVMFTVGVWYIVT